MTTTSSPAGHTCGHANGAQLVTHYGAADAPLAAGITAWLRGLGLDTDSPSLRDTPARVLAAWAELTAGYRDDPARHLARVFPTTRSNSMIAVTGVPFTSLCEHHLLPFTGHADIAYLPAPGAPVVGLSKMARLLDVYARRLQIQEQLTRQVTTALDTHLDTRGSACLIRSEHGCLAHRGARKPGAVMVTASYTGLFDTDAAVRAEFHTAH